MNSSPFFRPIDFQANYWNVGQLENMYCRVEIKIKNQIQSFIKSKVWKGIFDPLGLKYTPRKDSQKNKKKVMMKVLSKGSKYPLYQKLLNHHNNQIMRLFL